MPSGHAAAEDHTSRLSESTGATMHGVFIALSGEREADSVFRDIPEPSSWLRLPGARLCVGGYVLGHQGPWRAGAAWETVPGGAPWPEHDPPPCGATMCFVYI
ncbi:hypothetical protein NDU88_000361 [Pleurodeles waltl]|uniref:Uncharacterized protein n=1 Tax=Pleurodeles waltl TaxID=8319 RepID=A0AAV7P0T7_PLEWA|nr:hypothetical protein NDU88_000361 [Pleurodeles waltl]